jgi:transformation/transcription domain-associated protein
VQARGGQASQQVLREILKEVQNSMVPKDMLKNWANQTFASATDYWTFRKMFTLQLALAAFAEFVLHLSRLNPDMMYIHQDSGLINISYFKFDVDDVSGKLDSNRPVPFRMTPNITEFVTPVGVSGPLTASMISAARCFVQPSFKIPSILRAVLRDEMIAWNKKNGSGASASSGNGGNTPGNGNNASATGGNGSSNENATNPNEQENRDRELIITLVTKAVTVTTQRLTSLSSFDGVDSKVGTLVTTAKSHDNLCRMDPAWHPWL